MRSYLNRLFSPKQPDTGLWGESQAAVFLEKQQYKIKARRIRIGRRDEIDIVALDGDVLVFVEVKTRKSEAFGRPLSAVNRKKRRSLSRAAIRYLRKTKLTNKLFRFDVVEVIGGPGDENPEIRLVKNAFQLDKRYDLP
ncbi:MAG: YraN family protein [Lentisphaerae bacterium]|nr:YraN family protein [Lentisphaerota bacterium]